MKRLAVILLLLFVAACGGEELPPNPPPPGGAAGFGGRAVAGMAGAMPTWAAPAKNTAVTPPVAQFGEFVILSVSDFDYIYKNAYLFNSKIRTWEKFNLEGDKVDNWVKTQGIGTVAVDQTNFVEGENYFVVYACSKTGNDWDCNGNKWMLVKFDVRAQALSTIPEAANIQDFVIDSAVPPFLIQATLAEKDDFGGTVNVIRYDAKYREPDGITVMVHVFDFNNRAELDSVLYDHFKQIVNNGWRSYDGNNIALFLTTGDTRVTVWSSGKQIIYIDTYGFDANREIIEAYLYRYPSDLERII